MRKRPYFKMESAMTAILRDASGKMHHGILFDPPLGLPRGNVHEQDSGPMQGAIHTQSHNP